jgi:hypothetical protein
MTGALLASPFALGTSSAATSSLVPTQVEGVTSVCVPFTYTTEAGDHISATLAENNGAGTTAGTLNFCNPGTGTNPTSLGGVSIYAVGAGTLTRTHTMGGAAPAQRTETYGVESSVAAVGTLTIADTDAGTNTVSTVDFIGDSAITPINNTQVALAVDAPSFNFTGTTASFDVTATAITSPTADQSATTKANIAGAPVFGAEITYDVTSGPNAGDIFSCGPTDETGTATCTLNTVPTGTTSSDVVTFFINGAGNTSGPDSNEPQVTSRAQYGSETGSPFNYNRITVTCPTPGVSTPTVNTLTAQSIGTPFLCTIPTSQNTVTFTANVSNGIYAGGQTSPPTIHANYTAVVGAPVHFTVTQTSGTGAGPVSGDVQTDAQGNATFTVSDSQPHAGDTYRVVADVAALNNYDPPAAAVRVPGDLFEPFGVAKATYGTAAPAHISATAIPGQVTFGGTASFVVSVTDAVGNPIPGEIVQYTVAGRNNLGQSNAREGTTGADGTVTLTYTDATPASTSPTDTITPIDVSTPGNVAGAADLGTVNWIPGSNAASKIAVDVSGNCNTATPVATNDPAATATSTAGNPRGAAGIEVCALVTNAAGLPLINQSVTFTVDKGFISTSPAFSLANGKTVTVLTDGSGVARAGYVSSETPGAQTITAADGTTTGTATVTYQVPPTSAARVLTLAPATATIGAGGTQRFIANVVDQFGNPVPGVSVTFTQNGPGSLSALSAAGVTTDASGNAAGDITVPAGLAAGGTGSITASISSATTACTALAGNPTAAVAGACTATATYTVGSTTTTGPTALTLSASTGTHSGGKETITATVKNSDGSAAVNAVVRVTVSGADSTMGSATSNSSGVATFTYTTHHVGTDNISAYVDANDDNAQQTTEPTATATANVAPTSETPTMHIVKHSDGTVTVHVVTHPAQKDRSVHFYSLTKKGHQTLIGSKRTGHLGRTSRTFGFSTPGLNHGAKFRVRVRVIHDTGSTSHYSHIRVIQIKA